MGGVVFELDRFDLGNGNRCRLRGRWFGVRGRRFMRPALTLIGEGRRTRLLADLAQKPWVAEDGEPWEAVFEGDLQGVDLVEAELSVTPDITITLPVREPEAGARRSAPRARLPRSSRGAPTGGVEVSEELDRPQQAEEELVRGRLAVLTRQLVEAQNDLRRLRRQLANAEAERASGGTRVDALLGELEELKQARDAAVERNAASAERDLMASERDAALASRDHAKSQCDAALTARDTAVSERDAALAVRDRAVAERDRAATELVELRASSGAALVMRHATGARGARRYGSAIAVIVVVAVVLALVIAFGVL